MLLSGDDGEPVEVVLLVWSPSAGVIHWRPLHSAVAQVSWVSAFCFMDGEEAVGFVAMWKTDRARSPRVGYRCRWRAQIQCRGCLGRGPGRRAFSSGLSRS
jgi:hypothetical protein